MSQADLCRMANQIAAYFAPYGEVEAVSGIADHINQFWEPRMRAQLLAMIDTGLPGLDGRVAAAATAIRRPR